MISETTTPSHLSESHRQVVESATEKLQKLFSRVNLPEADQKVQFRFRSSYHNGRSNALLGVQQTFDDNSLEVVMSVAKAAIEVIEKSVGQTVNPFVKTDFLQTVTHMSSPEFIISASQGLSIFGETSNFAMFEMDLIFQNGINQERNVHDSLVDMAFSYYVGMSPHEEHLIKYEMLFKRFHLFRRPLSVAHLM